MNIARYKRRDSIGSLDCKTEFRLLISCLDCSHAVDNAQDAKERRLGGFPHRGSYLSLVCLS